jgi:hypothetical protein
MSKVIELYILPKISMVSVLWLLLLNITALSWHDSKEHVKILDLILIKYEFLTLSPNLN